MIKRKKAESEYFHGFSIDIFNNGESRTRRQSARSLRCPIAEAEEGGAYLARIPLPRSSAEKAPLPSALKRQQASARQTSQSNVWWCKRTVLESNIRLRPIQTWQNLPEFPSANDTKKTRGDRLLVIFIKGMDHLVKFQKWRFTENVSLEPRDHVWCPTFTCSE